MPEVRADCCPRSWGFSRAPFTPLPAVPPVGSRTREPPVDVRGRSKSCRAEERSQEGASSEGERQARGRTEKSVRPYGGFTAGGGWTSGQQPE